MLFDWREHDRLVAKADELRELAKLAKPPMHRYARANGEKFGGEADYFESNGREQQFVRLNSPRGTLTWPGEHQYDEAEIADYLKRGAWVEITYWLPGTITQLNTVEGQHHAVSQSET